MNLTGDIGCGKGEPVGICLRGNDSRPVRYAPAVTSWEIPDFRCDPLNHGCALSDWLTAD
ncbi:hypothetical protein MTER_27190 [Mycolicibacter terrae]|uniref:Uncharacterized protein n=1 Tax=Mycolicibacter terrae TaxID=1788 RepID=A0AAD1MH97_9MYCO|nr:hypothetical protein MTER_27190 [Mycolicibacter terrae]